MRLVAALLLAISPVFPQAPQGQTSEPTKKARIEGVVVSLTGEPVPRAQVRLQGQLTIQAGQPNQPATFGATSDDAGKFVIPDIDPGRNYQLTAQRPGFIPGRFGARTTTGQGTPLTLEGAQVLTGLKITLTPQGVISGHVTDVNGDPVQAALVAILRRTYSTAGRTLSPQSTNTTNDRGEFRVANLAPGRYYLMVQDRAMMSSTVPIEQRVNIATYYPNATDATGAAPLDVAAGQELQNLEIQLRQDRAFTIRGKATMWNGSPIPAGTTVLAQASGVTSPVPQLITSQGPVRNDGTFELRNARNGSYSLQVMTRNTTPALMGRADVNVADSDAIGVSIVIGPGAMITGHMRLEGGDLEKLLPQAPSSGVAQPVIAGVTGVIIGAGPTGGRPTVLLIDRGGSIAAGSRPGQVQADGSFQLDGLGPSNYALNVSGLPQGVYVKSAMFNGADVTHAEIDLSSGTGGTLELLLSNQAAAVTVSVLTSGDQSTGGRLVTLWPQSPDLGSSTGGMRTVVTDQTGSARFANIPPGTYYAAAWEELENGLQQSRDFLTLMTGDAFKLELKEGSQASANLQMIPTAKIKAAEEKLP